MASNKIQFFRNADKVSKFRFPVTTSETDVFAADATYVRDLTRFFCINNNSSARDLTLKISDGTDHDIIYVVTIPGNSGVAVNVPAVRLLNDPAYQLPGVQLDAFGNYCLRLAPGQKLRAIASATTSLVLIGMIESYEP